jgi:hypothetical protein
MSTLEFYADESGTDSNSKTAVVGGLLLRRQDFFWLGVEWEKVLKQYGISIPIHMREFGQHGALGTIVPKARLFTQLVRIINDNKIASVAATLAADEYRRVFDGITKLSMYGACFAQLVMMNDAHAELNAHRERIPYILDDGNSYKKDIVQAKRELAPRWPSFAMVRFSSDSSLCALQAADVVVWSVQRRLESRLDGVYEPLNALFDQHHWDLEYNKEWMVAVADSIRASNADH